LDFGPDSLVPFLPFDISLFREKVEKKLVVGIGLLDWLFPVLKNHVYFPLLENKRFCPLRAEV